MTDINKQIEEDKPIDELFADLDNEMIHEYTREGKLHPDFLPFTTYDLVQCGYPYPNRGEMISRRHGGTDAQDRLLPSKGGYCKVEDVKIILSELLYYSRWRKVSEEVPSHEDDLVLVLVKNKNKEDGIWLYDICYIDEGSNTWGKRHHTWEDIIEWKPID